MVDIARFQSVARNTANRNIALGLTGDKKGLLVSGNAIVRWVRGLKTSNNRAVSQLFINALKKSYGEQIATQVINSTDLENVQQKGKPLRSRKVMEALHLAEDLKQSFVASNKQIASNYDRPLAEGFNMTPQQLKLDQAVSRAFGSDKGSGDAVKAKFDFEKFGQQFKEEVERAGKEGSNFVTNEQAGKIADSLMLKQIGSTYNALLMEKMDVTTEGSMAHQAWSKVKSDPVTELTIDLSSHKNIAGALHRQFADKISDAVYRRLNVVRNHDGKEGISPSLSVPPEELEKMAEKVVGKLASERFSAAQAAQELPIENADLKGRMIDGILHGDMPASVIPAFCKVYPQLSQQMLELGKSSELPPGGLEKALGGMHDSVMEAMQTGNLGIESRDSAMRSLWHTLLMGQDDGQVHNLAEQMREEKSPLREFGKGAHYFRYNFAQSDFCQKQEAAGTYQSSIEVAGNYDLMLNNLAQVLQDKTGDLDPLVGTNSPEELSDEVIINLRNNGIRMPSPIRVGETNSNVPLSAEAKKEVEDDILSQINAKRAVVDGVDREFVVDLGRATYYLEGEDLGREPQHIMDKLREFCTDKSSGKLNEEMLLRISKVAFQSTFGSMLSLLGPGKEHLAPIRGMPSTIAADAGTVGPRYHISKNEAGDINVHMISSEKRGRLDMLDPVSGDVNSVELNSDDSHFGMVLDITFKSESMEPALNQASMHYALYAAEETPET